MSSHQGMRLFDGNTNGKTGQTLEAYQSTSVARLMQSRLSNPNESRDKKPGKASVPVKGLQLIETKTIEIVDVNLLESRGNKRMNRSVRRHRGDADNELRSMLRHKFECRNAVDCRHGELCPASNPSIPTGSELALKGCHSLVDGSSKNISKSRKIGYAGKGTSFPMPNIIWEYSTESMRICTTSMNGVSGREGCPPFSHQTHNPSIVEKIDAYTSKESDKLRSAIVGKINGNTKGNLYHLSPVLGWQGKLQSHCSSIHSEVQANVGDVKAPKDIMKNERLAKNIRKNMCSGASSTESPEACILDRSLAPPISAASSREVRKIMLPDLNLKLPALQGTSEAYSLWAEEILTHFEQPQPKPIVGSDDSPNEDPGNRWIKRLKVPSSSSSWGTKDSSMPKELPHNKVSNSHGRVGTNACTEVPETRGDFSKNGTCNNLLLSHAWIQRWLCNGSIPTEKKSETVHVSEPKCSILPLGSLEKAQLPSVAAMAMTGRAIARFQQPDVHKKGSITVWETKAF